jgi:hypothetical protein
MEAPHTLSKRTQKACSSQDMNQPQLVPSSIFLPPVFLHFTINQFPPSFFPSMLHFILSQLLSSSYSPTSGTKSGYYLSFSFLSFSMSKIPHLCLTVAHPINHWLASSLSSPCHHPFPNGLTKIPPGLTHSYITSSFFLHAAY